MDIDDAYTTIAHFGRAQKQLLLPLLVGGNICMSWILCLGIFTQYNSKEHDVGLRSVLDEFEVSSEQSKEATAAVMLGVLFGCGIFGKATDKFGRKRMALIMLPSLLTITAGSAFSLDWTIYVLLRFLMGVATGGLMVSVAVLGFECTGHSYWGPLTVLSSASFAIGVCLLSVIAKFITQWRILTLVISVPNLYLVGLFRLAPESPRWLYSKGRIEDAEAVFKRLGEKNGCSKATLDKIRLKRMPAHIEQVKPDNLCSILTSKRLLARLFIMSWIWFANSLIYYGLTLGSDSLGDDIFENTIFTGLSELPGYFMCYFAIDNAFLGRRRTVILFMLFGGAGATLIDVFNLEGTQKLILGLLTKMFISGTFGTIYVYTCELFPTSVRSISLGICSVAARMGGIACPYAVNMGKLIKPNDNTPEYLLYAIYALSSAFLGIFLAETLNRPISDTVKELERGPVDGKYRRLASHEDDVSDTIELLASEAAP